MRDMGVDISHVTSLKSHEPSVHGTLVFNGTKRIFSDPYQLSNFTAVEFLRIEKKAHKVCLKVLSLPWFFLTRNPDWETEVFTLKKVLDHLTWIEDRFSECLHANKQACGGSKFLSKGQFLPKMVACNHLNSNGFITDLPSRIMGITSYK